jgi:hypothetical protein
MNKLLALALMVSCLLSYGATIYVDNVKGSDRNDGSKDKPVASIEKGLTLLKKSDSMDVANTGKPYQRPYPGERGRGLSIPHGGTFEQPMIINGNGAVLTGLSVIPVDKWKEEAPGVYSLPFWPMSNMYKGYKQQNYWLPGTQVWWVDGQAAPNCKDREELDKTPGGFWWNKSAQSVLFKLPEGKKLDDLRVELPANYGFYITGDHTVVKDFYFIHSWNDGFDAAGNPRHSVYKNCVAIDNCGQGFSCHDTSDVYYEDCIAIRCASSGSCDVNWCATRYDRCIFVNNTFEAGIYTTDTTTHFYTNCLIAGNEPFEQLWQNNYSAQVYSNCVIVGTGPDKDILRLQNGMAAFKNCTIMNGRSVARLGSALSSTLTMENCLILNMKESVITINNVLPNRLFLTGNLYGNTPGLLIDKQLFGRDDWDAFRKDNPKDYSEWLAGGVQADEKGTSVKVKNRYGRASQVGASLPDSVWTNYEKIKRVRATPAGVFFD